MQHAALAYIKRNNLYFFYIPVVVLPRLRMRMQRSKSNEAHVSNIFNQAEQSTMDWKQFVKQASAFAKTDYSRYGDESTAHFIELY